MNIQLSDKYYLKNDSDKSFTICTRSEYVSSKTGENIISYPVKSYYTTLESALNGFIKRSLLDSKQGSLEGLLGELQETRKVITNIAGETQ